MKLTRSGQSARMTCTADARPEPSFKIYFNETIMVNNNKTYTILDVNSSHVGYYKCVAENILGNVSSDRVFLFLVGKKIFLIRLLNF